MIAVLGVSHKDARGAKLWFRHLRKLGAPVSEVRLMVFFTQYVSEATRDAVLSPVDGYRITSQTANIVERGYPGSASHLFVVSMTTAGAENQGEPMLWLESDAVPMHRNWFADITREYDQCEAPFMGHLEADHDIPHLAGVAVYPPNWATLSPMLASSHLAPDIPHFGRGKGQAFDAYAAPEVFPKAAQAKTIQQVFGKRHWRKQDLSLIRDGAALVHQSKDGSLMALVK